MSGVEAPPAAAEGEVLVGRCYTRARRHPLMLVKWPGGRGRIWGGPYTLPQAVVLAVSFAVLVLSRGVWAHFGLVNFVIALGVPYGLSLLVRHIQVDGRSPLSVAASAAGLLAAPGGGRLGGRPVRVLGSPRPLIGVCSLTLRPTQQEQQEQRAGQGAVASVPPVWAGGGGVRRPAPVVSSLIAARRRSEHDGAVAPLMRGK